MTSPSEGWAVGLYYDDTDYTRLQALLDDGAEIDGEAGWGDGNYLNVTWLVHDVHIWRTDRVLLDAEGGPVVETTMMMTESGTDTVVRRKLAKPAQLTALVGAIAAEEGAGTGAGTKADGVDGEGVDREGVVAAAQRTPLPDGGSGGDVRWEWGIGGVFVGLLAAAVFVRARQVRAGR